MAGLKQVQTKGGNRRKKVLVTCVGRQPGTDVWVFNKDIYDDGQGQLIRSGVLLVNTIFRNDTPACAMSHAYHYTYIIGTAIIQY